ncbi:MAG TPA: hypothetical protein VGD43_01840 [Micromonospora sp.]
MRDHADNHPRTYFQTRQDRLAKRVAGGALLAGAEPGEPPSVDRVPVNERSYPVRRGPAGGSGHPPGPVGWLVPVQDEEDPGYVIHLPIRADDIQAATRLAYSVAGSLAFLPELDPGETTVSTVDDQNNRHRVFCDLPLPDRSRCPQPFDHPGPCGQSGRSGPRSGPVPQPRDRS